MAQRSSFVVVANRLPVDEVTLPSGEKQWRSSPGGLVTALHPVLTEHRGTWIGWAGGDGPAPEPFDLEGIHIHPVPLSADELERYYEGQSNATIWPLYHDAVETPAYNAWRDSYRTVNQRFAEAAADVAAGRHRLGAGLPAPAVPAMLREMRPDLRIGFFLHIPFPPIELFMQMPFRAEILRGLLGADLVGFQQRLAAQNFVRLARHLLGLRYEGQSILVDGRRVKAGAFPISIDTRDMERLAATRRAGPGQADPRRAGRSQDGHPRRRPAGLHQGHRAAPQGLPRAAGRRELQVGDAVMVQVATPSRERVEHYQTLRVKVEREVGRINGEFGKVGTPAVHYLHQSVHSRSSPMYAAADVMMVTPLRDGMNLVAKEYIACRGDTGGALVLSEFAGAATELRQSFLCNPHDPDGVKDALLRAINAEPAELKRRMRVMQRHLRTHDVARWARTSLDELTVDDES
uniref:Trehalose-6-phosphate synthase n=1 Tax=Actinoplanes sp. SN223/29 TaxID=442459 RepID=A8QX04_9ACTN|nr:trehalose-6-phosphate synthase [Actinoplanes sp. SN223/29]